ncbi:MAG TPA: hypothetical protein VF746_17995 [Longimicrobium sp.]|jgi:hypothetical protein
MNGRYFRWCALALILAAAACGGDGGAAEGGDDVDTTLAPPGNPVPQAGPQTGPAPGTEAADALPESVMPQPQPGGAPTPIVRSEADRPSRASPAGQRYSDCVAQARSKSDAEREMMMETCSRLPDAPRRQ